MQVNRRDNESFTMWRKRVRIAQAVDIYGWRVWCIGCTNEIRHKPSDGPLRERRCEKCGNRMILKHYKRGPKPL